MLSRWSCRWRKAADATRLGIHRRLGTKRATVLVVKAGFSVFDAELLAAACPSLYSVKSLLVLTVAGLEHAEALNSSDVMTNDNSNGVFVDFLLFIILIYLLSFTVFLCALSLFIPQSKRANGK